MKGNKFGRISLKMMPKSLTPESFATADVLSFFHRQNLRPDHQGRPHPGERGDDDRHREERDIALVERAGRDDLDQQRRDRRENLADTADNVVGPAAEIGRYEAEDHADTRADPAGDDADQSGLPHSDNHRGEEVAPEEIRTENIRPTGRASCGRSKRIGVLRIDYQEADRRKGDEQQENDEAN